MKSETRDHSSSVVSRNITVEGEIRGKENLTVAGTVKGNLKIDGDVLISETGVVEADIDASSVVIKGKVTGDVTAQNGLEVHPKGEFYGMIRARLINIKEGAIFEGRSQMIRSPASGTAVVPKGEKKSASGYAKKAALEEKSGGASG